MAFIGNTNTTQAFTPAVDFFNGNGSTTAFTLSKPVASVAQVQAVISNVPQTPGTAFTVSGNTITFTSAPPSGTSNIYVYYTSPITQVIAPGQSTVTTTSLMDGSVTPAKLSTGGPSWDTSGNITTAGTINGLTVGKGAGAVSTNTAVGASALAANTSGSQNTALGYQSLQANTTPSNNTSVGYQAGFSSTTATNNVFIGRVTGYTNTTGSANTFVGTATAYYNTTGSQSVSLGSDAYQNNTTGSFNTAIGQVSLFSNTTASNNTAVGYQAGYSNTTGAGGVYIGYGAGYSNTSASANIFIGQNAGYLANSTTANSGYGMNICIGIDAGAALTTGVQNTFIGSAFAHSAGRYVTTGSKNTIIGGYDGNQGGVDIRTDSNNIVISDGDGNPRLYYDYVSASIGTFKVNSNTSTDSTNGTFIVSNSSGADLIMEAGNNSVVGISGVMRVAKYTGNGRSINAAGTVNQNGADYAEYMVKSGDFTVAKGDVVGINAEGKITNVFADAISFCVKSTDPGLVGGDSWFTEPRPQDENGNEVVTDTSEYAEWYARMEAARATVDRIAFCGQVPVNVMGATAGQYIVPVNDNGAIKGEAVSNPTFEQYQQAVGKVIAIEQDGRARIIVKVA